VSINESINVKHLPARSTATHPASPSDTTLDVCVTLVEGAQSI
jgi:hypothetical protein